MSEFPSPDPAATAAPAPRQFPCSNCGAKLEFSPGADCLVCPYCNTKNCIEPSAAPVEELDYNQALASELPADATTEILSVRCPTCGSESSFPPNVTAQRCPFCGTGIVAAASSRRVIKPRSLLPFHVDRRQAESQFRAWIGSLWFAPNGLAAAAEAGSLNGVYLPFWTYDAQTQTQYTGQRGDDYWDTETYTEYVDNKPVTRTRQVLRTRWTPAAGQVDVPFDDLLVPAARALPQKQLAKLEPWDLAALTAYRDEYLAGFIAQVYDVPLEESFAAAQSMMQGPIAQAISSDIGGDHQQISSQDTQYFDVTFKHLLLPVWLSAYRYQDHPYRFLINARTGEVQGERPYSWIKITLAILLAVLMVLSVIMLTVGH